MAAYHCVDCDVFGNEEECWVCGASDLVEINVAFRALPPSPSAATPNWDTFTGRGLDLAGGYW